LNIELKHLCYSKNVTVIHRTLKLPRLSNTALPFSQSVGKTKSTGGFAVRGVFARRLKASLPLSLEYVSNPSRGCFWTDSLCVCVWCFFLYFRVFCRLACFVYFLDTVLRTVYKKCTKHARAIPRPNARVQSYP